MTVRSCMECYFGQKAKCGSSHFGGESFGGARGGAADGDGRRVAGAEPEREAAALGAAEPAASQRAAHDCGGFGDAADAREFAGAAAGAAERVHRTGGAAGAADGSAAG